MQTDSNLRYIVMIVLFMWLLLIFIICGMVRQTKLQTVAESSIRQTIIVYDDPATE